jgi:hypothetical protein
MTVVRLTEIDPNPEFEIQNPDIDKTPVAGLHLSPVASQIV